MSMDGDNPRKSVDPSHISIIPYLRRTTWTDPDDSPPLHNNNNIDPLLISVSSFVD
jgi:hypothetical protein